MSRFVERDMVMRYHWGLGVGHLYSRTGNGGVLCPSGRTITIPGLGDDSIEVNNILPRPESRNLLPVADDLGSDPDQPPRRVHGENLDDLPDDDSKSCSEHSDGLGLELDDGQGSSASEDLEVWDRDDDSEEDWPEGDDIINDDTSYD